MATRSQRRARARQRQREATTTQLKLERSDASPLFEENSHGGRMMATIEKAAESRQPKAKNGDTWDPEKVIPPPINPDHLWTIYELNAVHAGAINAKVADSVGRGWKLVPEDDSEEGASANADVDKATRTLTDTLKAVCPKLTFAQLCRQAVTEMDAVGWGAWEVLRETDGDPSSKITGVLPVPAMGLRATKISDDVFCLRRGDKKVYFKRFGVEKHVNFEDGTFEGDGGSVPEDKRGNELILFSHYTPRSPWYGIPSWISAMPAIAELTAIREFNVSFFESGGQADRHIHVAADDDKVAEDLGKRIEQLLEDARGEAHVSLVTWGPKGTEVTTTPLSPQAKNGIGNDRQFRGGREDLIGETLVAHGVPPYRVGINMTGALAGDVAQEMDDEYRIGVVEPLQEIVEAELERTLFSDQGFADLVVGYSFEFEDMTQEDEQANHDRAMEAVDKGVMSPNDAREATGQERKDDPALDRHYLNGQPVSTDPAVTEGVGLIQQLRDALRAAVGSGPEEPGTGDPADAVGDGDETESDTEVAASDDRRPWYSFLRRDG